MSIIRLGPDAFQNYTIETVPQRTFVSSSADGVEGDIVLFADASPRLKDIETLFKEEEVGFDGAKLESMRVNILSSLKDDGSSQSLDMSGYLEKVNSLPIGTKQSKRQEVLRYEPGARFDKNHLSKNTIRNVIFPHYRLSQPKLDWSFDNYQNLNMMRFASNASANYEFLLQLDSEKKILINVDNKSLYDIVWAFESLGSSLQTQASINTDVLEIETRFPLQDLEGVPFSLNDLESSVQAALNLQGIDGISITYNLFDETMEPLAANPFYFFQLPFLDGTEIPPATSGTIPAILNFELLLNVSVVNSETGQVSGPPISIPFQVINNSEYIVSWQFEHSNIPFPAYTVSKNDTNKTIDIVSKMSSSPPSTVDSLLNSFYEALNSLGGNFYNLITASSSYVNFSPTSANPDLKDTFSIASQSSILTSGPFTVAPATMVINPSVEILNVFYSYDFNTQYFLNLEFEVSNFTSRSLEFSFRPVESSEILQTLVLFSDLSSLVLRTEVPIENSVSINQIIDSIMVALTSEGLNNGDVLITSSYPNPDENLFVQRIPNSNQTIVSQSSSIRDDAAIIYPSPSTEEYDYTVEVDGNDVVIPKGHYAPSDVFTFDFWIKPKTPQSEPDEDVSPGTVIHMRSCYAISVATGSSRGPDGYVNRHRILVQLSGSANNPPSSYNPEAVDDDYAFFSKNSLLDGEWNHICIRWPGRNNDGGVGSIWVNGELDTEFTSSKTHLMQGHAAAPELDPDALFVGNFFEGNTNASTNAARNFFGETVCEEQGLTQIDVVYDEDPTDFSMRHLLWAELHEIKIRNRYLLDHEIVADSKKGLNVIEEGLLFYLPLHFIKSTRERNILQTPFQESEGTTEDPFNIPLSFGVGGYLPNSENFLLEFVRKEFPRLYGMHVKARQWDVQEENLTANDIIYGSVEETPTESQIAARRRLHLLLPCDNGKFRPSYELLTDDINDGFEIRGSRNWKDVVGLERMVSVVGLSNLQTLSSLSTGAEGLDQDDILAELIGPSPERLDPSATKGSILTILQRTLDPSSNEIVIFDISNMFYGDRIKPRSFELVDESIYGYNRRRQMRIVDNGEGVLYRADAKNNHASWNCVGNVIYDEGLVVLKSPLVRFFGKQHFRATFRGEKNVHVQEISIPLEYNLHNLSSNPTYRAIKPTDRKNEVAEKFAYITGINLHDNNLNVIGRAHLAQPLIKREEDRMVIKLRMDF